MSNGNERREEFAAFLRSRRARLHPGDVGLPAGARRRVAGLRREEVAQLAGVGLTWYTWLEQGRPIAASEQVLTALARALRLTVDERDHLFALGGVAVPDRPGSSCVQPAHRDLLEKLLPYPAAVQTSRFDILAYNRAYRFLFDDFDRLAPARRNCAVLLFTDPVWRDAHLDLAHAEERIAARLRAAWGRHHDEPSWQLFVADLRERSPRFRELWDTGEVATERQALKRIQQPALGELRLEMTSVWLDETSDSRLVWFAPTDAATAERVEKLAALAPGEAVSAPAA